MRQRAGKAEWRLLVGGLQFPEGPVIAPDGTLWWVEVEGGRLGWWRDGETGHVATGGRPNGAAIGPDGLIWFCDQGHCAVRRLDQHLGQVDTITSELNGLPLGKPNDLAFDNHGNLLFTCPNDGRTEPSGYVCCLAPDGRLKVVATGFYFCNGLAFLRDGRLVVAETYRQRLWIGDWDASTRTWIDPRPWVDVGGPVGPDGMAVSPEGDLLVAIYGQGKVIQVTAEGAVERTIDLPGINPTNLCFTFTGNTNLILTEAAKGGIYKLPWASSTQ